MRYFLIALLLFALPVQARADEIYTFVVKKQEEKQKNRWSLADWLDTRDKMRLMDLWLAIHSPSPYEFFFGGTYQKGDFSSNERYTGWSFFAAGYATIFGLEIQREGTFGTRWIGMVDFRIFGFHAQATNITLQFGLKHENTGNTSYRNALVGGSMTFYLTRYAGIEGLYRHYFSSTPDSSGVSISGNRYEAGAFIDFRFWRIYGDYFWAPETLESSGIQSSASHSGVQIGTKFFL